MFQFASPQETGAFKFHVQIYGVEIETVRPSGYPRFHEYLTEKSWISQRLNHYSAPGKYIGKVSHALGMV